MKILKRSIIIASMLACLVFAQFALANNQVLVFAKKTHWFASKGKTTLPTAYVIIEPNCWYCMRLYHVLAPLIKQKKIKIRWIIVSFLQPSSLNKAAAILSAKNKNKALQMNEFKYQPAGAGGEQGLKYVPPKLKQKIMANNRFMDRFNISSTPTMIYRDRSGHAHILVGLHSKSDILALLSSMSAKVDV